MIPSIRAMFQSGTTNFVRSITYAGAITPGRYARALSLALLFALAASCCALPALAQRPANLADLPNSFYSQRSSTNPYSPFEPERSVCVSALANPESLAAVLGEQVYVRPKDALSAPTQQSVLKSLADVCRMSIEARRYLGEKLPQLAKQASSEPVDSALQLARPSTAPLAAFIKEFDHNFYSTETITREIPVYNDTARETKIILGMELRSGRRVIESVKTYFTLAPGEPARYRLNLKMPKVKARKDITLTITAGRPEAQAQSVYSKVLTVRPAPKGNPCGKARVQGYRLNPAVRRALAKWKVKWSAISDLSRVTRTRCDVLIVGSDTLAGYSGQSQTPDTVTNPHLQAVERFVESGGTAIVLEQDAYPASLFGLALETRESPTTVAFNAAPHHSIMRELSDNDLRYWRGDNRVSHAPFVKPSEGSGMVLAECGTVSGLELTPLILAQHGRGRALLCQLLVGQKVGREPAADALLRYMLRFAAQKPKPTRRTAILARPTSTACRFLNGLGLEAEDVDGTLSVGSLGRFGCIFADASDPEMVEQMVAEAGRLEGFLKDGGALVIHDLQPGDDQLVTGLTGTIIEQANVIPTSCAWKDLPLAVLDGVSNYDLFMAAWQEGKLTPIRDTVKSGWRVRSGLGMNLIEPAGLLRIPYGKGQLLIDSLLWEGDDDILTAKRARYISALLRNLGAEFGAK